MAAVAEIDPKWELQATQDALRTLAREAEVVRGAAISVQDGPLSAVEKRRMVLAVQRIDALLAWIEEYRASA